MAMGRTKIGINVLRFIFIVPKVLKALAVGHVVGFKLNHDLICANFLVPKWYVNAMVFPKGRRVFLDLLSISCYFVDCFALIVDE